jgi:hypothetical protein
MSDGIMAPEDSAKPAPGRRWRPGVLAELERFGLRPRPTSDPERVRDFLKVLYTHEIRLAKIARREAERVLGPQPLEDYRRRVLALKARYPLLGLPLAQWAESDAASAGRDPRGRTLRAPSPGEREPADRS